MKEFISESAHGKEIVDVVFEAAQGAVKAMNTHGDANVVNGAFGTFFKEDGTFMTFDTFYRAFDKVPNVQKARYASSIAGPKIFQDAVKDWLFGSIDLEIDADVIATPGGTGALSSTIKNTLTPGESVIHPDIGWGPYKTIAKEQNTPVEYYTLFDGESFNVDSFRETTQRVMRKQGKVLVFINDPCQNPTGYTMRKSEWDEVITILNTLSDEGPVVLLHDIAYIDFNLKGDEYKHLFKRFSEMNDNVLTVVAFSASKSMTAYGMRLGAQVLISRNETGRKRFKHACGNTARGSWSTINNGAMMAFANIALDASLKKEYLQEKQFYVTLLSERAALFIEEANRVGLPVYPYQEGFFITLRLPSHAAKNELHFKLKKHNIFFVNVYGGLRIAICSIPKHKLKGLAQRIKSVYDTIVQQGASGNDQLQKDETLHP